MSWRRPGEITPDKAFQRDEKVEAPVNVAHRVDAASRFPAPAARRRWGLGRIRSGPPLEKVSPERGSIILPASHTSAHILSAVY